MWVSVCSTCSCSTSSILRCRSPRRRHSRSISFTFAACFCAGSSRRKLSLSQTSGYASARPIDESQAATVTRTAFRDAFALIFYACQSHQSVSRPQILGHSSCPPRSSPSSSVATSTSGSQLCPGAGSQHVNGRVIYLRRMYSPAAWHATRQHQCIQRLHAPVVDHRELRRARSVSYSQRTLFLKHHQRECVTL